MCPQVGAYTRVPAVRTRPPCRRATTGSTGRGDNTAKLISGLLAHSCSYCNRAVVAATATGEKIKQLNVYQAFCSLKAMSLCFRSINEKLVHVDDKRFKTCIQCIVTNTPVAYARYPMLLSAIDSVVDTYMYTAPEGKAANRHWFALSDVLKNHMPCTLETPWEKLIHRCFTGTNADNPNES